MRILILDDDKALREMLGEALTARGHDVSLFADPTEATVFHGQNCPCVPEDACAEVIIADIVMPSMKGIELVKSLKDNGCWPLSVGNVAIVSGYLTLHYMNELNDMGIQYFRKPFTIRDICEWVDSCKKPCLDNREGTEQSSST